MHHAGKERFLQAPFWHKHRKNGLLCKFLVHKSPFMQRKLGLVIEAAS
jgi:hypothetical protein